MQHVLDVYSKNKGKIWIFGDYDPFLFLFLFVLVFFKFIFCL